MKVVLWSYSHNLMYTEASGGSCWDEQCIAVTHSSLEETKAQTSFSAFGRQGVSGVEFGNVPEVEKEVHNKT